MMVCIIQTPNMELARPLASAVLNLFDKEMP